MVNTAIATQGVAFQVSFDATPNLANMDGVIGLSLGLPPLTRTLRPLFAQSLGIHRCAQWRCYAATTSVPYIAGLSYHFRLQIHQAAHTTRFS